MATTESIEFLISAEDQATAKVRKVTDDIKAQVAQVKNVGGQAKASTELVGTLATSLGGAGIGRFAGEMAQLTERVSAFSEVAKSGAKGATLMKAGIVAAVAVMAFKFGEGIGKMIFDTGEYKRALVRLREEFQRLASEGIGNAAARFAMDREEIGLIIDPEKQEEALDRLKKSVSSSLGTVSKNVAGHVKRIEEMEGIYFKSENFKEEIELEKQQLAAEKAQLSQLKEQNKELLFINSNKDKYMKKLREEKKLHDDSKAYLTTLEEEVSLLRMTTEELRAHEIAKNATSEDAPRVTELLKERDALLAKKKAEDEAAAAQKKSLDEIAATVKRNAEAAEAAEERLHGQRESTLEQLKLQIMEQEKGAEAVAAYRLEQMGFDAETAKGIAKQQAAIQAAKSGVKSVGKPSSLTGSDQRLMTGRGETEQNKLFKITQKVGVDTVKLLNEAVAELKKIVEKEEPKLDLQVVGD